MRAQGPVARAKQTEGARRSLQLCALLSVIVVGCSVYEPSLLSGRGGFPQGDEAGGGGLDGVAGSLLSGSDGAGSGDGGRTGNGGAPATTGGDGDEAGAPDSETAGSGVIITYGGASAGSAAGGSVGLGGSGGKLGATGGTNAGAGAGGTLNGSAGASSAGSAGSAATVRELAKGQPATASTIETGNEAAKGNDGISTTRWCAFSGTMPQWWRVDLGASRAVTQVVLKFEHPDRKYTYVIETSPNDAVFTQQAMVNGIGDTQKIDLPAGVTARYVRITVTAGAPYTDSKGTTYPTWASFWEVNVYGR